MRAALGTMVFGALVAVSFSAYAVDPAAQDDIFRRLKDCCKSSAGAADNQKDAPSAYLAAESARILKEGDRIQGESIRLRAEAHRLDGEGLRLRDAASHLDTIWAMDVRANPALIREFRRHDRSQLIMRADAQHTDSDADKLRLESKRLDAEAARLWKLAAAVDPDAQDDILRRLRERGSNTQASLAILRAKIVQMAQAAGVNYVPQ